MSKTRQVSLLLSVMFTSILFAGSEIKDAELNLPPELGRVLRDYESAWLKHDAAEHLKFYGQAASEINSTVCDPARRLISRKSRVHTRLGNPIGNTDAALAGRFMS